MDPMLRALQQLQQLTILREIHDSLVTRMRALTRISEEYDAQQAILMGRRGLDGETPAANAGPGATRRGAGAAAGGGRLPRRGSPASSDDDDDDDSGGGGGARGARRGRDDDEDGFIVQVEQQPDGTLRFMPIARARRDRANGLVGVAGRNFEEQVLMRVLAMSLEAAQQSQASAPPKISSEDLDSIRDVVVTKAMLEKVMGECAVCQEDIAVGSSKVMLPCTHLFCRPCIEQWLNTSRTCPVCRMEMVNVAQLYVKHAPSKAEPPPREAEWRRNAGQHAASQNGNERRGRPLQQALAHASHATVSDDDDAENESRRRRDAGTTPAARSLQPQTSTRPVPAPLTTVARAAATNVNSRNRGSDEFNSSSDDDILVGSRTRSTQRHHRQQQRQQQPAQRLGMTRDRLQLQRSLAESRHDEAIDADEIWNTIGVRNSGSNQTSGSYTSASSPPTSSRGGGNNNGASPVGGVRGLLRARSGASPSANNGNASATSPSAASSTSQGPSAASTPLHGPRRPSRRD